MNDKRSAARIPPLHSLVAFETVARLQSAPAAARELGVSRSALSHSLTLLEHRLGVRLFVRYSPTARLTPAGQTYYDGVEQFARAMADALYRISDNVRIGLRLSASPGLSRFWLSKRLPAFQAAFPRIDLTLSVSESLSDVLGHQTDVALRYGGSEEPGTESMLLWHEAIAPVARPELARRAGVASLERLVIDFPLIEHGHWNWRSWLAAQSFGGEFNSPVLTCHDLPLTLEAAATGFGIAVAPVRLIADDLASDRLARAHQASIPGKPYRAVVTAANARRPAIAAFLQWLQGEAQGS